MVRMAHYYKSFQITRQFRDWECRQRTNSDVWIYQVACKFLGFFIRYIAIWKQLLIWNDNRVRWALPGLSQDGAWSDLFENLSVNGLKGDLSNATVPPLNHRAAIIAALLIIILIIRRDLLFFKFLIACVLIRRFRFQSRHVSQINIYTLYSIDTDPAFHLNQYMQIEILCSN